MADDAVCKLKYALRVQKFGSDGWSNEEANLVLFLRSLFPTLHSSVITIVEFHFESHKILKSCHSPSFRLLINDACRVSFLKI